MTRGERERKKREESECMTTKGDDEGNVTRGKRNKEEEASETRVRYQLMYDKHQTIRAKLRTNHCRSPSL